MNNKRIIVGISGASGAIYGIRALNMLREAGYETHLILSKAAETTIACETHLTGQDVRKMADHHYPNADIGAAPSSGSFRHAGMIIAPCSVKSLAEIATGLAGTLLSRAADVTLKERRRLVILLRETPLHATHLKNMLSVTEMGGIIAPPVPAFYTNPESLDDIVDHTVGRALDLFDIETSKVKRWTGTRARGTN